MANEAIKYDQLIIYYFSGTGNAKNAATWIINLAKEHELKTELIAIDKNPDVDITKFTDHTLIGFCFPTHGFNAPPIILNFLHRFPVSKQLDVFILNTRGGLKLSKLFLPGLSGLAQLYPALILFLKWYNVIGMQPLDLPSNWLILHPGLKKNVINSIYERCRPIVRQFATDILHGRRRYKAMLSFPIDLALIPIAILYYLIGRFFLAKTLAVNSSCNNCGKCILECPVQAISMVHDRPFWSYRCESCMRCVNRCGHRAIETTHTFSIGLLVISSLFISPALILLMDYIGAWEFFNGSLITEQLWFFIDAFIFLLFVFGSYRLLHYCSRFPWFERWVTSSSLSHYSFWRRYKAPKF